MLMPLFRNEDWDVPGVQHGAVIGPLLPQSGDVGRGLALGEHTSTETVVPPMKTAI